MSRYVRVSMLAAVFGACAALTSCGLPSGGTVEKIDHAKVPYHLLDDGPVGRPRDSQRVHSSASEPKVYWTTKNSLSTAATGQSCATDTYAVVQALLSTLAKGPDRTDRAKGLSTALTPNSRLALLELSGRTAVVELEPVTPLPAGRLPLAVGQVVLTVTSAPGVDRVVLRGEGERLQIPLPGGALIASPVSAKDYSSLIRSRGRKASDAPAGCHSSPR